MPHKYTLEEHFFVFWNKVAITADDNQCWLWIGARTKAGYGNKYWEGHYIHASRIAWMYPNYIIPDGMLVCHSCDNPACCNPKHLFLGTHKDNTQDMIAKGREGVKPHFIRESNPHSKLTSEVVDEIRKRYATGTVSYRQLSSEYRIGKSQISRIIRNVHWKE